MMLVFSLTSNAQSSSYETLVEKLGTETKTQVFTLTKDAFALLTYFDVNMREELKTLVDDINLVKIIVSNDKSDMFMLKSRSLFDESDYSKVDLSKYKGIGDSGVYIDGKLVIKEVHILVDYNQGAIVSFFGSFKMRDIRKLIKQANNVSQTNVGN